MISFAKIMRKVLLERMSFSDLYNVSDPKRIDRSKNVNARSLRVTSMDGQEAWTFNYKSNPSTTGHRWHGYVRFLREDVTTASTAAELDCMVDCDCPDYRYRFAYNNAKQDAGAIGPNSWNQNNGRPPRPREQGGVGDNGPGMCKHLIALGEFLKTKIEPEAPEPEEPVAKTQPQQQPKPVTPKPKPQPKPQPKPASQRPQTIDAPKPEDDSYSDSRGDMLQETTGKIAERLSNLVKTNPEFDVTYYDED